MRLLDSGGIWGHLSDCGRGARVHFQRWKLHHTNLALERTACANEYRQKSFYAKLRWGPVDAMYDDSSRAERIAFVPNVGAGVALLGE